MSGGEKARLCLAKILLQKNHVILLDEPTNHLDFETVEALAQALRDSNVTVIFVSHNRTFVEIVANGIIEVKNKRIKRYNYSYEEYVYHLQRDIEEDLVIIEKPHLNLEKEEKKKLRNTVKEAKKRLKYLEKEMLRLKEEKKALLEWFEEKFTNYSEDKTKRLAEIEKKISEDEEEWIELELELEVLEMPQSTSKKC